MKRALIDIELDLLRDIEKVLPNVEASDIRLQLCKKPTLIHHKNLLAQNQLKKSHSSSQE